MVLMRIHVLLFALAATAGAQVTTPVQPAPDKEGDPLFRGMRYRLFQSLASLDQFFCLRGDGHSLAEDSGRGADGAPTEPQNQLFQKYSPMLDQDLTEWGSLVAAKDLPVYQKLAAAQNPGPVVAPK